ncbi:uncharacterized protein BP5553_05379 [Venustampulla echinocandica]|uniref:BCAS2 family protein n=1 Tax=Venustampulla echinocandica TaxID=2656787 RepID=A0A370TQY6_9HELO|nr:uncharacterized protein BP5553_05379 [Venustampulla echinocandica]RDL37946.1 hypothetical protein BP5553_05379 [Venustampulla echinocandica]
MPLVNAIHESLPYVDTEPTAAERAAAESLIAAELGTQDTQSHPSLPPLADKQFSAIIEAEFPRIEAKEPLKAIDLSRYEALEPPPTTPSSDEKDPATLDKWREALGKAYTSQAYLSGRQTNLALLEQFGKNSWLVGNSQLEDVLRAQERELAERKVEIDGVVIERKTAQEAVGAEIRGLEETWKRGVGRVLETEVAAEQLRRDILERRRQGAS